MKQRRRKERGKPSRRRVTSRKNGRNVPAETKSENLYSKQTSLRYSCGRADPNIHPPSGARVSDQQGRRCHARVRSRQCRRDRVALAFGAHSHALVKRKWRAQCCGGRLDKSKVGRATRRQHLPFDGALKRRPGMPFLAAIVQLRSLIPPDLKRSMNSRLTMQHK